MNAKRLKLLVVEDEAAHVEAVCRAYESAGLDADIRSVGTLSEFRTSAQAWTPDLALVDLNLPDGRALEVLTHPPEDAPFPILVMTAFGNQQIVVEVMKAGALDYVVKSPEAFADLPRTVERALREWELLQKHKRMETALRENRELLAVAERLGKAGGWELDVETGKQKWTEMVYRIHEVDSSFQPTAENGIGFYAPASRPILEQAVQRAIEHGEPFDLELEIITAKGNRRQVRAMGKADSMRRRLSGFFQDVTEHRQAEAEREMLRAQLIESQKMESIGTLASGVAHEINNPIMGIMNYAQLILDRLGPDSPVSEFASEIGKETERVATIVRNLLSFARHDKEAANSPARMYDIVESTLSLIRTVMRHDQVALDVDVPSDLPQIRCRSQQIQQVLMNLLTNARDALSAKYPEYDENKVVRISARMMGGR